MKEATMKRHLTLFSLLLALLLPAGAGAGIWQPSSGGGGAAPVTATISSGVLAAGAEATGDEGSWFDLGSIFRLQVASTASTCVDVELYAKDTKLDADRVYYAYHLDGATATWVDRIGVGYSDDDASAELHWRITNCGAVATTVTLTVDGVGQ